MAPTHSTLLAVLLTTAGAFVPKRLVPKEEWWNTGQPEGRESIPIEPGKPALQRGPLGSPPDWDIQRRIDPQQVTGPADVCVCCLAWGLQLGLGGSPELYTKAFTTCQRTGAWWHFAYTYGVLKACRLEAAGPVLDALVLVCILLTAPQRIYMVLTPFFLFFVFLLQGTKQLPFNDRPRLYEALKMYGAPYSVAFAATTSGVQGFLEQQAAVYGFRPDVIQLADMLPQVKNPRKKKKKALKHEQLQQAPQQQSSPTRSVRFETPTHSTSSASSGGPRKLSSDKRPGQQRLGPLSRRTRR